MDQLLPTAPKHEIAEAGTRVWARIEEELKKHDTSLRSLYGDGWSVGPLDNREFRVLTAVSQLGECSVPSVLRVVENWAGGFSFPNVMILLDGLQRRQFVTSRRVKGSEGEKGSRTLFKVTSEGERALRRAQKEGKVLIAQGDEAENGCTERVR